MPTGGSPSTDAGGILLVGASAVSIGGIALWAWSSWSSRTRDKAAETKPEASLEGEAEPGPPAPSKRPSAEEALSWAALGVAGVVAAWLSSRLVWEAATLVGVSVTSFTLGDLWRRRQTRLAASKPPPALTYQQRKAALARALASVPPPGSVGRNIRAAVNAALAPHGTSVLRRDPSTWLRDNLAGPSLDPACRDPTALHRWAVGTEGLGEAQIRELVGWACGYPLAAAREPMEALWRRLGEWRPGPGAASVAAAAALVQAADELPLRDLAPADVDAALVLARLAHLHRPWRCPRLPAWTGEAGDAGEAQELAPAGSPEALEALGS
ncbi:hypothetical protein HYH03_001601 [Edaphochlamys debaryana]|uniref:Uncharacterized protein n=1 Tax=Edaphochlamys debaryana TaxID=47281 RepID=A0A835YLQ3_9CHLO|nr:hypothetical protein HYH03_001601 [Edaphochlamys debaryana]|eukprot:KAG2500840.1 hypothetical protein HYH03_001601 [Edaphochlamys debaryana]